MIRIAIYAWTTGFGLVFATALVGPKSGATQLEGALESATVELPLRAAPVKPPSVTPREQRLPPAPAPPQHAASALVAATPAAAEPGVLAPAALAPAEVAPTAPVSVQFDGLPPSQIVGDRVNLNLATSGNIVSYAWTVMPPGTVGLKIYDGGAKADFTSRFAGTYVFLVAVAGVDGSVAQAYHAIDLRAEVPTPDHVAPDHWNPVPPAETPAATATPARPTGIDPATLLRQWTLAVKSRNRRSQQLLVASGFRQAAGAIDAGLLTGSDLLGQTRALCALSLGGALGPWEPWFEQVEQLYRQFEQLHLLGTPANFSAANKSVARVLEMLDDD